MTTSTREKTSNKTDNKSMVVAVFRDRSNANAAYSWLITRGYRESEINFMMSDETRGFYEKEGKIVPGSQAIEGVATGGTIGAAVGATTAAILAVGTAVAIPGLGWVAGQTHHNGKYGSPGKSFPARLSATKDWKTRGFVSVDSNTDST